MNSRNMFVLLLIAFGWTSASNAAVLPRDSSTACPIEGGSLCYRIQGEITQEDFIRIKSIADQALNAKTRIRSFFHLDSEGGDVDAAIAIGRELRRMSAKVSVREKCLSACVFVMAGAVQRTIFSNAMVGIHRPYSLRTDERSYDSIQREQKNIRERAKQFLEDMNLPSTLYDAMLRVPASEIKILSKAELAEYGLGQDDPVKQEVDDAKEARRYGISKQELFARKAEARSKCGSLYSGGRYREFYSCWDNMLKNPQGTQAQ